MVTNFKKSFLLLITAIFFTQSLILGCSTEVDSEIKKMEEDKETSKTPVFVGTWDSFDETITIDDKFTFSLETKKESGTVQDVNNGFKCVSTTKDDKGNNKTYNFTKVEADVISSSDVVTGKTVYFVKHSDSQKDAELNGIWECDNGTEIIINAETKKICVTTENGQIWGTYTQNGNTFVIADENGNILGSGFVSASGKAYFYNEATDSFEIYTKDAEAGAPVIPLKKFTVTYKSEFADDVVKPCAENVEITLEDASYEGYRFDGWYTDEARTVKAEAKYKVTQDLVFYAKWVQQGKVTFVSEHSEHDAVVVDLGNTIEELPAPTKEKYDFDGWYDGETKVSGKYTVTKDVELVAKWTALYNVTFETAGGSPVDSLENVRAGTKFKLPKPKLDGYDFEWWATEGKTYAFDAEYEVNSDVIFVAKWVGLCRVVYNTDGGSPVESKTVHDMDTIEMPAAPTKDGHRFLGWYTTDKNNLMQPGDIFNVTDSVTINAKWIAVYTYEYNDGIPADEDPNYQAPTVDDGYVLTLKAAPVRDGYVFKGWKVGEQLYDAGATYTITKDTVFTAEWNPEYTYQFEGSEAKTVENGTKITIANALEAEDCTFAGWYDGTNTYQHGVEYEITDNVSFTAVWNVTVTYVSVYSQPEADVIKKGDSLVLPTPTYDGYSFGGWFDDADADAPVESPYTVDANITLTARWAYSISGVPTNDIWQPEAVVAWVWNDNVETGFVVKPTFDKGTADYSFKTAEDIKYCTIFVVDLMPSEPVTKDALTENATAKSADMDISSGKAVFETYKEVYTITNVGIDNWYRGSEYENYIKISGDEESWVKAEYDDVNKILTFATDKEFDTCVACGFAKDTIPEELDLSTYSEGTLKKRSVILIMVDNTAEFAYDMHRQIGDTNTVYFRDEDSFQYNGDKNIYVYFSSSTDKELSELKVAMENCGNDNWFKAAVDYTKYDTVRFSGVQDGKMVYTTTLIMEKNKPYYRRYSSKPKQNGNYVLACCDNSSDDPDDLLNN